MNRRALDPCPSPQARRQVLQQQLQNALAQQDRPLSQRLMGQWVHRQGIASLEPLLAELAAVDPEAVAWWRQAQPALSPPEPAPRLPIAAAARPPLSELRAWLPGDQEQRRAA